MLFFYVLRPVKINSILLNLLCVWILLAVILFFILFCDTAIKALHPSILWLDGEVKNGLEVSVNIILLIALLPDKTVDILHLFVLRCPFFSLSLNFFIIFLIVIPSLHVRMGGGGGGIKK